MAAKKPTERRGKTVTHVAQKAVFTSGKKRFETEIFSNRPNLGAWIVFSDESIDVVHQRVGTTPTWEGLFGQWEIGPLPPDFAVSFLKIQGFRLPLPFLKNQKTVFCS